MRHLRACSQALMSQGRQNLPAKIMDILTSHLRSQDYECFRKSTMSKTWKVRIKVSSVFPSVSVPEWLDHTVFQSILSWTFELVHYKLCFTFILNPGNRFCVLPFRHTGKCSSIFCVYLLCSCSLLRSFLLLFGFTHLTPPAAPVISIIPVAGKGPSVPQMALFSMAVSLVGKWLFW